jgi:SAM-dependent methyltransferase
MISDRKYRAKLAHRGRGLADLERLIGGVVAEVDAILARRATARILEVGCGYGTALLELRARYGDRVDLHGLNRQAWDGNRDILLRNAADRGLEGIVLPTLHYADVADGLPFPTGTFDLVFSQVAWMYFGNKIAVLREILRVLDEGGVAKIDVDEMRPGLPPEYARLTEIWEAGRLVPLREYASRFGMALSPALDGEYLHFGRCPGFGGDLELVCEIDLARLYGEWNGIKCVYRVTTT